MISKYQEEKGAIRILAYILEFHREKGERILSIAKILPKINFHLYGDKKFLKQKIN